MSRCRVKAGDRDSACVDMGVDDSMTSLKSSGGEALVLGHSMRKRQVHVSQPKTIARAVHDETTWIPV